jgi:hypothetical protein
MDLKPLIWNRLEEIQGKLTTARAAEFLSGEIAM